MTSTLEKLLLKIEGANPTVDFGNAAVGVATLCLALVTVFVALRNSGREGRSKIGEFRRDWIEDLRNVFADHTRITHEIIYEIEHSPRDQIKKVGSKHFPNLFRIESYTRLKLNPNEDDHVAIVDNMVEIRRCLVKIKRQKEAGNDTLEFLKPLQELRGIQANLSSRILKREWDRLKDEVRGRLVSKMIRRLYAMFWKRKTKEWHVPALNVESGG